MLFQTDMTFMHFKTPIFTDFLIWYDHKLLGMCCTWSDLDGKRWSGSTDLITRYLMPYAMAGEQRCFQIPLA